MPRITGALAEHANKVDYGQFNESDPDKYVKSLIGLFGGLKRVITDACQAEKNTIWSNSNEASVPEKIAQTKPVVEKWNQGLVDGSFEILNACEALAASGPVDLTNLDVDALSIPDRLRSHLKRGIELTKEEFREFNELYEKAEKTTTVVKTRDKSSLEVPMVIFRECGNLSPLAITNICYSRLSPNTIAAVYAGSDRPYGGDQYDIGIKQETLALFSLENSPWVKAFNEAEAEARKRIFGNLDALVAGTEQPNAEQEAFLALFKNDVKGLDERWKKLRDGFKWTGHGEPTVFVSGGSLLAASKTSLLTVDEFNVIIAKMLP